MPMTTKTLKKPVRAKGVRVRGGQVAKNATGKKTFMKRSSPIKRSGIPARDPALESALESASDLHSAGLISDARMREYERLCVAPPPRFTRHKVRDLRMRFGWSQSYFAAKIGASASTVEKWEAGVNVPSGGYLKILDIIDRKGAQVLE